MNYLAKSEHFSKQLLELSSLSEVCITSLNYSESIKLAHGPFIKLDNENTLYDLRSYKYKSFIGHNHPLFLKFSEAAVPKFFLEKLPSNLQYIEAKDLLSKNILKSLSEKLLTQKGNYSLYLKDMFFTNNLFLPNEEVYRNAQNIYFNFYFRGREYYLSTKELNDKDNIFINSIFKYIQLVIINGERNTKINKFLNDNLLNTVIHGNLIIIPFSEKLSKEKFSAKGILLNNENYIDGNIFLFIPISITNSQLKKLVDIINELREK